MSKRGLYENLYPAQRQFIEGQGGLVYGGRASGRLYAIRLREAYFVVMGLIHAAGGDR